MGKKTYFYHFLEKKEVKLGKIQKKAVCGHQLRTHDPFLRQNKNLTHFNISEVRAFGNTFAKPAVRVLINDPPKKSYGHQLGPMTCFLTNQNLT